jgi:CheY-like chemotaxis protein
VNDSETATRTPTRLVLVDDEDDVREVAETLLREEGYDVRAFACARAALAAMERDGCPAALLVDVAMPDMTGIELAEQVRPRWPGLPIVFMTGNLDPDIASRFAGLVLRKPYRLTELLSIVSRALA